MPPISTKLHGAADYATGIVLLAAPRPLAGGNRRARALLRVAGAGTLLTSALTDYEFGVRRVLPMRAHLTIDAATGSLLSASGLLLRRSGGGFGLLLRFALLGGSEIAAAVLTERTPAERRVDGFARSPTPPSGTGASTGTVPSEAPPVAPAPVETPGPSVTPPEFPQSDVERAERVDADLPDAGAAATGDVLVAQQEAAAGAEAAMIGGEVPSEGVDPALEPVYEAGGGEQEGFEAAEQDLVETATHSDGGGSPERDALTPELESDHSSAVYAETNRIVSTEVVEDPAEPGTGPEPGADPEPSADRGSEEPPHEDPPSRAD